MFTLILFILGSLPILIYSWKPLHLPRSHGFYRFFAFESILLLILLNAPFWFIDPFSVIQWTSWLLLVLSLLLAIHGFTLLKKIGKPSGSFEETTVIVVSGAYRIIRHPLYTSLLLLTWGACLKNPWWNTILLSVISTLFIYASAKVEESENIDKFGKSYVEYRERTYFFLPYLW
jgi:protein-S-isoprenylcysteine O-methyltransferase Ste14